MYFTKFSTVSQIKAEYHRLAKLHHPDLGGSTATMQAINSEYQEVLARCDGQTSKGSDGKDHTYTYNAEVEQAIMDKIAELLTIPGVEVWLIGTWVWIDGDTRPVKEKLKSAKCCWHSKRKKWYWHGGQKRRRYNKNASLEDLAETYGAKHFKRTETAVAA